MSLDTLTTAGTLAIVTALLFLATARVWQILSGFAAGGPVFPESTMREAAQRFRDETERLRSRSSSYLAALLVSGIIFIVALGLDLNGFYRDYPEWQLNLIAVLLLSAAALVAAKIVVTFRRLLRARFERDANIAVGHELLKLAATRGSVFHDVSIGKDIIDHVLVGPGGIYAVHVIAKGGRGGARLLDERLLLGKGDALGLEANTNRVQKLSAEFSRLCQQKVRVRSVVAVPGWDVDEQDSQKHLLVNERTLTMLTGWKSQTDYLMDEDVAVIQRFLTEHGKLGS